jgi:Tfp pilus assembly protein PilP
MRLVKTLVLGSLLAAAGSGLYAQTKTAPATKPAAKTAAQKPATAKAAAPKPAAAKPAVAKTVAKKTPKAATPSKPAESAETKVARRDPFESLTSRQEAAAKNAANLPPGKAGLQVGSLRLDGIVRSPNGMIAVVTNPQARTYFLREGDQLYDGRVEKIGMDAVSFHELGKDAFGKPVERQVNKRLYSSAGDQQ